MMFVEAILWKRRRARGPLAKPTCSERIVWHLGVNAKTGEFIVGDKGDKWLTRTVRSKLEKAR